MLTDSIATLAGVGEKRALALNSLGIATINDLLFYFPFRYTDLKVKPLEEVADQEQVTLKGTVVTPAVLTRFGPHKSRLNFKLQVEHAVVAVTFFNQPWLKEKFEMGVEAAIFGKWDGMRHSLTGMKLLATQNQEEPGLAAVYPVNKSIRQQTLIALIKQAYEADGDQIVDVIPEAIRTHYRLLSDQQLVAWMHFPETDAQAKAARRTAIFREFFLFQVQLQSLKTQTDAPQNGLMIPYDNQALRQLIATLPFDLTNAQKRVVNEICADMRSPEHMNRLLQGDVGSGKTIVAAIVMYAAITARYQAALMVPTEVLAEQHFAKLSQLFADFPVRVALLTGSTTGKKRRDILADLASGEIDLIIGTHALIQDAVNYNSLGLVIIDEQHRFGVNQRRILQEKGLKPDLLSMTATPIPRTLAITTYGEMDVSTIDELPAGRQPITTTWIRKNQMDLALQRINEQLAQGSQVFAITPLIAESEKIDLQNAEQLYQDLQQALGDKANVALLHGQMKPDEKDTIMRAFSDNIYQVLVSTTVVEVGVDVPNATVMLIMDADRFGLSQLHQLRGRVGRGKKAAYCILVANPKNDTGIERMQIMTETNDGFVLAQKDLELRGSGEIFGDRQSGMPNFKIGDPVGDFTILEVAQQEAKQIFTTDADLSAPEHAGLAHYLSQNRERQGSLD
ncbi:DNA helicase RecG [Lacticaseibacillus saniviri JCM 17471 = DSM 24301]|uniref:ATP-dependent DNA helicase RecG n=1 Tax=Lacticaseibacillus saniviri JCM 17471 = DSM 24301 TaxID=1293598 RepID=A0A0R2MYZ5_9LACO|nr:DNA helicase RecG [Lacticaseibacillus saniviri JCM 17471 = DSM 24301]